MLKGLFAVLTGLLSGVVLAGLLLQATHAILQAFLEPPMAMERWVIYLGVVLGAGFGSITGALAAVAGVVAKGFRTRGPSSV
jgi:hypothetical protein